MVASIEEQLIYDNRLGGDEKGGEAGATDPLNQTNGDARYARLGAANTFAEAAVFSKKVTLPYDVSGGISLAFGTDGIGVRGGGGDPGIVFHTDNDGSALWTFEGAADHALLGTNRDYFRTNKNFRFAGNVFVSENLDIYSANLAAQVGGFGWDGNSQGTKLMMTGITGVDLGAPGAGKAILFFKAGTNPDTLKLVARAGASGAVTTILDNIPT